MKLLLAALFAMHGIAHLVGFLVFWRLFDAPELPYRTTILSGSIDLTDWGIRLYGAIWLILALAFGASAVAVVAEWAGWQRAVLALSALSLAMCAAGWPETRMGLLVNLGILAWLLTRSGIR